MKIEPFKESYKWLEMLLGMYEVDTEDPDVQQNIINALVCIDNCYRGFDDDGRLVGIKES